MTRKPFRLVLLGALWVLGSCSSDSSPDGPSAPTTVEQTPVARAIVELTNAERARAGLPVLEPEPRLAEAAQAQADQMVQAARLDHVLPGARYPTLQDRIQGVGYPWQAIGENLAYGQTSAAAVVADWMRSPAHRENILNPAFAESGVGYADDGGGRRYFAQVFARRR